VTAASFISAATLVRPSIAATTASLLRSFCAGSLRAMSERLGGVAGAAEGAVEAGE
jgi:hypothetical protein